MARNRFGQEIGAPLPDWSARLPPPRLPLQGRFCRLEPLEARHAAMLHHAYAAAPDGRDWTYMPREWIEDEAAFAADIAARARSDDPLHHVILDEAGRAVGSAALMRIDRDNGVVEIGHVAYSPALARTRAGTEAIFLLACRVFDDLGYRRLEWKCDALNIRSRRAARRYGFVEEGTFRQALVTKGRNRDTAWFSILDGEWPALRPAFERWLAPDNFDERFGQRATLESFRARVSLRA